jgi:hypothetical protein
MFRGQLLLLLLLSILKTRRVFLNPTEKKIVSASRSPYYYFRISINREGTFMSNTRNRALSMVFFAAVALSSVSPALAQNECNLLGVPLVQTGSITAGDGAQTQRLNRDGRAGTCEFLRTPPAPFAGTLRFDQYTYTNTTGGPICVFVDVDATGCGVATNQISIAAYLTSYNPSAVTTNLIGDPGLSTGQNFSTSMNFAVPAGATYIVVVHNLNTDMFCPSYTFRKYETNNCRDPGFDHNNDGSADLAIWSPSAAESMWSSYSIATMGGISANLGSTGDIPVDGDYDGDEISSPAVFRPSNGTWYLSTNPQTNYDAQRWGASGDIPVEGDYDRDGLTDLAVYRPSTNRYFILLSETSVFYEVPLGIAGDRPAPADYDGDGKYDAAVWRPSNGLWTWLTSAGSFNSHNQRLWGATGDIPVPADYDGDGKADISVFRPSNGVWYVFQSGVATGNAQFTQFGTSGDIPQPADYDADRKADFAVYRPSDSAWWIQRSTAGIFVTTFGEPGDIPTTTQNPHVP